MTKQFSRDGSTEGEGRDYKGHKKIFVHYLMVIVPQVNTFAKT